MFRVASHSTRASALAQSLAVSLVFASCALPHAQRRGPSGTNDSAIVEDATGPEPDAEVPVDMDVLAPPMDVVAPPMDTPVVPMMEAGPDVVPPRDVTPPPDARCGLENDPCCAGNACMGALACEGGRCVPCGAKNALCCPGSSGRPPCADRDAICGDGRCRSCGHLGDPCCASDTCAPMLRCYEISPGVQGCGPSGGGACGGMWQGCCSGGGTTPCMMGLTCTVGFCTPACGTFGNSCCPGSMCGGGLRCGFGGRCWP